MKNRKDLRFITKVLRTAQTPWEAKLWYHLRNGRFFGLKFKRQVPIDMFVADFCCQEKKIIIELDGGQHNELINSESDIERQQYLESKGYSVMRFWNSDIDHDLEAVLEKIRAFVFEK